LERPNKNNAHVNSPMSEVDQEAEASFHDNLQRLKVLDVNEYWGFVRHFGGYLEYVLQNRLEDCCPTSPSSSSTCSYTGPKERLRDMCLQLNPRFARR